MPRGPTRKCSCGSAAAICARFPRNTLSRAPQRARRQKLTRCCALELFTVPGVEHASRCWASNSAQRAGRCFTVLRVEDPTSSTLERKLPAPSGFFVPVLIVGEREVECERSEHKACSQPDEHDERVLEADA